MRFKQSIAGMQIVLLLVATFAFSFIINSSTAKASSLSSPSVCCERTKQGGWCINTDKDECDPNFKISPTSCESTSYCKLGTCYDSLEGICMENTPQRICQEEGGTWDSRKIEEIPQCQLGCCIIGDQAALVSLVRCKRLSSLFGVEIDYRPDITNEADCIAEAQSQDVGACVYEKNHERVCEFTTRKECGAKQIVETINGTNITLSSEKRFYKNYLCSAEELATSCARQAFTGCYQGKVYWFDSCGNRENVYSADKDKSWNNGRVAKPDEICDRNDGSDKDCGNCDYMLGSRCAKWDGVLGIGKPTYGEYYCKKTTCKDRNGNERKNGESWCIYDGSVGNGTDPVGSRHYKATCVDGEIIIEPCADYRNEICIEGEINGFKTAACRVNRWQSCTAQTKKEDCENIDKRDCVWMPPISGLNLGENNVGGVFTNPTKKPFSNPITGKAIAEEKDKEKTTTNRPDGVCVPSVPPGLKFWEDGEAKGICAQANLKCIVKFEKSKLGGKKCIENCECLEESWALHANQICRSLGDCGGYVNYVGEYTDDGYEWKKDGKDKKFSPNNVNKIVISAMKKGRRSKTLKFGYVAGALAGIGLIAGIVDLPFLNNNKFLGKGASTLLMPREAFFGFIKEGTSGTPVIGNIVDILGINKNWLAAGAWNALMIGAIVFGGAKLFGADKNTANALGSAVSIGLFSGEIAGQLASIGTFSEGSTIPVGTTITQGTIEFAGKTFTATPSNPLTIATEVTKEGAKEIIIKSGEEILKEGAGSVTAGEGGAFTTALGPYAPLINLGVTIAMICHVVNTDVRV